MNDWDEWVVIEGQFAIGVGDTGDYMLAETEPMRRYHADNMLFAVSQGMLDPDQYFTPSWPGKRTLVKARLKPVVAVRMNNAHTH